MKKLIITLLCIGIAASGGYYGYSKYQKKKDSKRIVDVVPVQLLTQEYWADEQSLDGTVTSGSSQNVYLDSEKLVKELNVSVGDSVKKGDVILTYDMTVVELETEQKKNRIAVLEQQISEGERELERIKNLKPSELAPIEPDEPYEPYEPEIPEEPDIPDEPVEGPEELPPLKLIDKLVSLDQSDGPNEENAFIFRCTPETQVSIAFMSQVKSNRRQVLLYVYDENEAIAYFWDIDGRYLPETQINDWCVGDGVMEQGGSVYFDSTAADAHGTFKGFDPEAGEDIGDDFDEDVDLDADMDNAEFFEDDYDYDYDIPEEPETDENDENYIYTRAELQQMVKEQESEIKQLKIDLKSAKLDYENSRDRQLDGKVTATIDGVVVKVGSEQDGGMGDIGMDMGEGEITDGSVADDYGGAAGEDAEAGSAYIVIQGEEGVCIDINVGELNLYKFTPGTMVSGMSYDTGESFTAEVLSVGDEPVSYSSYMWNENPDSSTFIVKASVDPGTQLTVGNWVSITMPQDEQETSGLFIPIHYTRKDGAAYYVMKADKNGKLKKQYLNTGKIVWGSYIEVKGGIGYDDMLCFPYGKDVKEGVKTRETDNVLY